MDIKEICESIYQSGSLGDIDPVEFGEYDIEVIYLKYLAKVICLQKDKCFEEWLKLKGEELNEENEEDIKKAFDRKYSKIGNKKYQIIFKDPEPEVEAEAEPTEEKVEIEVKVEVNEDAEAKPEETPAEITEEKIIEVPKEKKCARCGKEIKGDAKYCPECEAVRKRNQALIEQYKRTHKH